MLRLNIIPNVRLILLILLIFFGCSESLDQTLPPENLDLGNQSRADMSRPETDATHSDDAADGVDDLDAAVSMPMPTAFSAGYAQIDITPPLGTYMGGFGGPGDQRGGTGTHDPLMAQALLVTNDSGQTILLISLDVAGFFYDFGEWGPGIRDVREAITLVLAERLNIAPHQIVISSSHTHAGTDLSGINQDIGEGINVTLLNQMLWKLVTLASIAADQLEPANIAFIKTTLNGWTRRDRDCSLILDNTLSGIEVTWPDAERLPLYLINFANHPTMVGSNNTKFSADFVWGIRERAKEMNANAMFLQGFIAAVHGRYELSEASGGFDRAREHGQVIFDTLIQAERMTNSNDFSIESREVVYDCVARESFMTALFKLYDMPKRAVMDDDNTLYVENIPVSWHHIGDIEFVVWPGEPSPEYALMLKAKMTRPFRFTVGLGNDSIGYIVEPQSIENDPSNRLTSYELMMGLGIESGPCAWRASESLGWFATPSRQGNSQN